MYIVKPQSAKTCDKPQLLHRDARAMANLSQTRPNILPQFFWRVVSIETQNLGKAQALGVLPAVEALLHTYFNQRDLQPRPRGVAKEKEMKKQKETEKKDEQSLLHE